MPPRRRDGRTERVLIDIEEYERLKARDTRRAYAIEDLPDDWVEALKAADYGKADPELESLMK